MMNHLSPDDVTGYIHRTLDDAHREVIDNHLLSCQTCRVSVSEHNQHQRRIATDLSAALNSITPSNTMQFSSLTPNLQHQNVGINFWSRVASVTPATLAFSGLFLAIFGIWQALDAGALTTPRQRLSAFPALACFAMVMASVEQSDRSKWLQPRVILTWVVAFTLWLGSAIIGVLNLIVIRDLAIFAVLQMSGGAHEAGLIAIISVYIGVMLYIGFVIGGAEYHYRNVGQPGSWKLFSYTLLGQLLLLILPYIIM